MMKISASSILLLLLCLAIVSCSDDDREDVSRQSIGGQKPTSPITSVKSLPTLGGMQITIENQKGPLGKLLADVREQSGRAVFLAKNSLKYRSTPVRLTFRKVPFWAAIATVARETKLGIAIRGERILLTDSVSSPLVFSAVGNGLLVLHVPIDLMDRHANTMIQGLSLTLYHDSDEMSFVKIKNAAAVIKKGARVPLTLELMGESSPWSLEWIGPLPSQVMRTSTITVQGEIEADCRRDFIEVRLAASPEAKVAIDGLAMEVVAIENRGQEARARVIVRQSREFSEKNGGAWSVIRVFPLDQQGKTPMPFGYRSGGSLEEYEIDATIPSSILNDGQIAVVLAKSKNRKLAFQFDEIKLK